MLHKEACDFKQKFLVINIFFRYPTDCWYVHKIQTALSSEWRWYNWVWREEVLCWCKSIFRSWCKLYSQVIYHLRMMSLSKSIFRSWCKTILSVIYHLRMVWLRMLSLWKQHKPGYLLLWEVRIRFLLWNTFLYWDNHVTIGSSKIKSQYGLQK